MGLWQSQDGGGGGGGGGGEAETYSNAAPTVSALGGIAAGSTFAGKTMQQMWDALLYPYQVPAFSSFSISGQSTTLEVGAGVTAGSKTFAWATSNSGNITVNSLAISDVTGAAALASGLANDGSEAISISEVVKTSATSHVWRITGTNTQAGSFTRDFTVSWRWRLYYGESTATTLDEAAIEALRVNALAAGANAAYAFNAGGYKWLCYPTAFGLKTTFKDSATNLDVAMQPAETVSVTNAFGVTTNYYCHRTLNQLGGAITIQVS